MQVWRKKYDEGRSVGPNALRSACFAPHANLFFDQLGKARVCCWNHEFPAGDITRQSIDEIWNSAEIQRLRRGLELYRFRDGCEGCGAQVSGGDRITNMRSFDGVYVDVADPAWPRRIELSISNACNLECVMCDGEYSSAIRTHREGRRPRRKIYSDKFLCELRPYIPHLELLKFLGGEPFLVPEYYRIWAMMTEDNSNTVCHLTTNATVLTKKARECMEKLKFGFAISFDGVTKNTIESIRVNAKFEELMRNVRELRAYTKIRETPFGFTYCFMRQNWHEFGEFCAFAEEFGAWVSVNTVTHPPQFGIYNLRAEELRSVLVGMERQSPTIEPRLSKNRNVWLNELERVRRRYSELVAQ